MIHNESSHQIWHLSRFGLLKRMNSLDLANGATRIKKIQFLGFGAFCKYLKIYDESTAENWPPGIFGLLGMMNGWSSFRGPHESENKKNGLIKMPFFALWNINGPKFSSIFSWSMWIKLPNLMSYPFLALKRMNASDHANGAHRSLEMVIYWFGLFCKYLKTCDESTTDIWYPSCWVESSLFGKSGL